MLRVAGMGTLLLLAHAVVANAGGLEYDQEPIRYSDTEPQNPVTELMKSIESGALQLENDPQFGWLPGLLKALDIPPSSQTLVFSKTSLQRHRISPDRPRALYFNDEIYVGYCQGGDVIEVSVSDPALGTVFYSLDQTKRSRPEFTRQGDACLTCHGSSRNQGFPSHLIRSVYTDPEGLPILSMGSRQVDQTTPFAERWGGWYVTGTHGNAKHLGNLIVRGQVQPSEVDNRLGQNVTDLEDRFDTSAYLTPHSDLVALLVLEHQTEMHNRITRLNFQTRMALWQEAALKKSFGESDEKHYDSTLRRIASAGDDLIEYMLFCDEPPLAAPVAGTSTFQAEFQGRGARDQQGRSLRDFDLTTRLFKYPCSYLIDSTAFDALPEPGRDYVLRRLWEILTSPETDKKFAHLSPEDRQAILEILIDTKDNLPDYWKSENPQTAEAE